MDYSQPRRLEERVAHEVVLALCLLGLALCQTALLPRPLGFAPDLLLLLVLCQSLLRGPARAARWALYGGIALDLCANCPLGSHALALLAAVVLAALPLAWLSRGNWLLPLGAALLGAPIYYAVLGLLTTLLLAPLDPRSYLLTVLVPGTLTVLIPILPMFLLLRLAERRSRGEVSFDPY